MTNYRFSCTLGKRNYWTFFERIRERRNHTCTNMGWTKSTSCINSFHSIQFL